MASTKDDSPAPMRVFRPKWKVCFDDGNVFPGAFGGIHLGTVAERRASNSSEKGKYCDKTFNPECDMIFIDTYVFEHCERADAIISFDVENGLPENLEGVLNVAIDARSLSLDRHDVWHKKLRFILRYFPKVKRITVVATVVLDIASPDYMTEPMYHMDIQNISIEDRSRHGILFGDNLPLFPHSSETLRPSDFALTAWNDMPNHWPSWKKRKEDNTAPCLFMTAMVYFEKEWISLDGEGGPGGPCKLGTQRVDVAGTLIRNEVKRQSTGKEDEKRKSASKPAVNKQKSFFSLGTKKPKFPLGARASMPILSSKDGTPEGQI